MEWVWTVAGIVLGAAVGVAGARLLPRARRGAPPDRTPEEWERRLSLLAVDVKDALEKMDLLYDRIRKRAKVPDEPHPANERPQQFLDGAAVLRHAREKGLIR